MFWRGSLQRINSEGKKQFYIGQLIKGYRMLLGEEGRKSIVGLFSGRSSEKFGFNNMEIVC